MKATCGHPECKSREHCARQLPPPKDKRVTRFEVQPAKDGMGRQHFAIRWWDPNFHGGPMWRGQHFHAVLSEHTTRYKRVEIIEVDANWKRLK